MRRLSFVPLLVFCLAAAPATKKHPTTAPAEMLGPGVLLDLRYGDAPGSANMLDLYLPEPTAAPRPLIVLVHGGGWMNGDKVQCNAKPFTDAGYALASINYRLSNVASFPAQIYDCKGAIRWLRAHASVYSIDPDRIGAFGASAGGHLVALLASSADVKDLEGDVGGNLDQTSRVQAVCDWFGPTDLSKTLDQAGDDNPFKKRPEHSPIALLFGGPQNLTPTNLAQANPITFITKDDPPFLIMHGDKDNIVPVGQSDLLVAALRAADVPCTYQVVKGAGHGTGFDHALPAVLQFFNKHLKSDR